MRKDYVAPQIRTEKSFETSALACAKTTDPPPGSWHFASAYDTFTGHWGSRFEGSESASGAVGVGPYLGTTTSASYANLCGTWVLYSS